YGVVRGRPQAHVLPAGIEGRRALLLDPVVEARAPQTSSERARLVAEREDADGLPVLVCAEGNARTEHRTLAIGDLQRRLFGAWVEAYRNLGREARLHAEALLGVLTAGSPDAHALDDQRRRHGAAVRILEVDQAVPVVVDAVAADLLGRDDRVAAVAIECARRRARGAVGERAVARAGSADHASEVAPVAFLRPLAHAVAAGARDRGRGGGRRRAAAAIEMAGHARRAAVDDGAARGAADRATEVRTVALLVATDDAVATDRERRAGRRRGGGNRRRGSGATTTRTAGQVGGALRRAHGAGREAGKGPIDG